MLDLDFVFFNMMNTDKQGLVYRKFFLDRLAPVLFVPRLEKLIKFNGLGLQGGNIFLPLGQGNWDLLEQSMKRLVFEKSISILEEYQLPALAVDMRLKNNFASLSNKFPLVFGDNFIKALAIFMVKSYISIRAVNKLILVGETQEMPEFIESLKQFQLPVSIQNNHPLKYEVMSYHLLYEKGVAVSTSFINPADWAKGDLVIIFETKYGGWGDTSCQSRIMNLTCHRTNLAPELENNLKLRGLDTSMSTMAPILESCLYAKAGFPEPGEEQNNAVKPIWNGLNQAGEEIGLWDYFLDNGI